MGVTFRKVFFFQPPSSNQTGRALRTDELIREALADSDFPAFGEGERLFARVVYFNHDRHRARDIHNIVKPLFDVLRGKVYPDDKLILRYEAIRLDMYPVELGFVVEFKEGHSQAFEVARLMEMRETAFLVEISPITADQESMVSVTWVEVDTNDK